MHTRDATRCLIGAAEARTHDGRVFRHNERDQLTHINSQPLVKVISSCYHLVVARGPEWDLSGFDDQDEGGLGIIEIPTAKVLTVWADEWVGSAAADGWTPWTSAAVRWNGDTSEPYFYKLGDPSSHLATSTAGAHDVATLPILQVAVPGGRARQRQTIRKLTAQVLSGHVKVGSRLRVLRRVLQLERKQQQVFARVCAQFRKFAYAAAREQEIPAETVTNWLSGVEISFCKEKHRLLADLLRAERAQSRGQDASFPAKRWRHPEAVAAQSRLLHHAVLLAATVPVGQGAPEDAFALVYGGSFVQSDYHVVNYMVLALLVYGSVRLVYDIASVWRMLVDLIRDLYCESPPVQDASPLPGTDLQGTGLQLPGTDPQGIEGPLPAADLQGTGLQLQGTDPQVIEGPLPAADLQGTGLQLPGTDPQRIEGALPAADLQGTGFQLPGTDPQGSDNSQPGADPALLSTSPGTAEWCNAGWAAAADEELPDAADPLPIHNAAETYIDWAEEFDRANGMFYCMSCGFYAKGGLWKRVDATKHQRWFCGLEWSEFQNAFPQAYQELMRDQARGGFGSEQAADEGLWEKKRKNARCLMDPIGCGRRYKKRHTVIILEWKRPDGWHCIPADLVPERLFKLLYKVKAHFFKRLQEATPAELIGVIPTSVPRLNPMEQAGVCVPGVGRLDIHAFAAAGEPILDDLGWWRLAYAIAKKDLSVMQEVFDLSERVLLAKNCLSEKINLCGGA